MATGKQLVILLSTIVASLTFADGFPDGAPVDACVKPKPNQPYHGQAKPQPLGTNPYAVIASAEQFTPGSQITGMYRQRQKVRQPILHFDQLTQQSTFRGDHPTVDSQHFHRVKLRQFATKRKVRI